MARKLRHAEKKILVGYVRYARRHRDSNRLPFILFGLLFFDAFVMVIPSMLLTAAAITITPRRWPLFCSLFVVAVVANNTVTYWMGKFLPHETILSIINYFGIIELWQSALEAILHYGKYATFLGGFLPLPTQLVTMILGLAEQQALSLADHAQAGHVIEIPSIQIALAFAALGHGLKIFIFGGLVRYGWVKLEQKVAQKNFPSKI